MLQEHLPGCTDNDISGAPCICDRLAQHHAARLAGTRSVGSIISGFSIEGLRALGELVAFEIAIRERQQRAAEAAKLESGYRRPVVVRGHGPDCPCGICRQLGPVREY